MSDSLRRRVAALFLTALVVGVSAPSAGAAQTKSSKAPSKQSEIDRQRKVLSEKIAQANEKANSLLGQLRQSEARRNALQAQISALSQRLKEAEGRLAAAEADLGQARNELIAVEASLGVSSSRIDQMKARLADRSRTTYINGGGTTYLEILVGASDVRDLATRFSLIQRAMKEDRSRIEAVETLRQQLETHRTDIIQRKTLIAERMVVIEREKSNINEIRRSVSESKAEVVAEMANYQGLLAKVQADKAGYLREMAALEASSRTIAGLLKARQRGQVYQAGSGKKLGFPTTGSISSSFGHRTHPIFKDRRMHAGVDIAGKTGQPVLASESGTVVFAGPKGGYGNIVVIDHGNALATAYAHLSSISVANGATVKRGARVGALGCSGYCTGPHLHFEVRINGDPVNPMQFLG